MRKCPNCGSTAQVKRVSADLSRNKQIVSVYYECGCGSHFEAMYEFGENDQLEFCGIGDWWVERRDEF